MRLTDWEIEKLCGIAGIKIENEEDISEENVLKAIKVIIEEKDKE